MAIAIKNKGKKTHKRKNGRSVCKSKNPYLKLLCRLYGFLSRRTDSKFNAVIAKRLMKARRWKAPLSLMRLVRHTKGAPTTRIAACVGTITDDARLFDMPKLSVCALRFTETARARIVKAGGECLTFDQLALRNPTGAGVVLLRGPTKRTTDRHFGKAPGLPGSHTRPHVRSKGRKFEKARGRRNTCGYKK